MMEVFICALLQASFQARANRTDRPGHFLGCIHALAVADGGRAATGCGLRSLRANLRAFAIKHQWPVDFAENGMPARP